MVQGRCRAVVALLCGEVEARICVVFHLSRVCVCVCVCVMGVSVPLSAYICVCVSGTDTADSSSWSTPVQAKPTC